MSGRQAFLEVQSVMEQNTIAPLGNAPLPAEKTAATPPNPRKGKAKAAAQRAYTYTVRFIGHAKWELVRWQGEAEIDAVTLEAPSVAGQGYWQLITDENGEAFIWEGGETDGIHCAELFSKESASLVDTMSKAAAKKPRAAPRADPGKALALLPGMSTNPSAAASYLPAGVDEFIAPLGLDDDDDEEEIIVEKVEDGC